jgi:hypothetical protein
VYKLAKTAADGFLKRFSQALPKLNAEAVEEYFPAHAPFQPTLPVNVETMNPELRQRFAETIVLPEHRIYRLRNIYITWNGAIFRNFRIFPPSVVRPEYEADFQDTVLLRQWIGEQVTASTACVAVCQNQWSVENYYHWLIDTLPRLLVLRDTHPDVVVMLPQPNPPRQLPDYIKLSIAALGFKHYLPINNRQILRASCAFLPELTAPSLMQKPELVQRIRAELLGALATYQVAPTRRIYAARANTGVRKIVNVIEVDAMLAEFGFEKVYFEHLTFLDQIQLMRETEVFFGVHGAGMTNLVFLQPEARIVELLNSEKGELCYYRLASCLQLKYYCAPGEQSNPELGNHSDIIADLGALRNTLNQALESAAN